MSLNRCSESGINKEFLKTYKDFFERLEFKSVKRAFCFGYRINSFLNRLVENPFEKIFVLSSDVDEVAVNDRKIVLLKGELLEKLQAFPRKTFSFITSLWLPEVLEKQYLKEIKRILKSDGYFGVFIAQDLSPKVIIDILKKEKYILKKTGFPKSRQDLRNLLELAGFVEARIWEGKMEFNFDDVYSCIENFELMGGDTFFKSLPTNISYNIRKTIFKKLSSLIKDSGGLKIEYDYLSAICVT